MPTIDLNADLGEGFGVWRMGDDAAMLRVVTSANIACGFHAGDPDIMANCFEQAKALGVAVGAHVSFPDLAGFGRRALPMSAAEIERAVAYQLGAAIAVARYVGHEITFVKAHGALANLAERDAEIAGAIASAVAAVDPSLTMLAIARSAQVDACRCAKMRVAHEVFADRAYTAEGRLVSRSKPGAVIEDAAAIVARVLKMLEMGAIVTENGALLKTPIELDLRTWRHAASRCHSAGITHSAGARGLAPSRLRAARMTPAPYQSPRYLDAGEAALSVEFGDSVDPEINARVLTLDAALREAKLAGVEELVPTYRSLMIHYEPLTISRADLVKSLESFALHGASAFVPKARWHVPCCYDPALAEDIIEAARNPRHVAGSAWRAARKRLLSRLYVWIRAGLVLSRRPAGNPCSAAPRQPARGHAAGRRADRRRAVANRRQSDADRLVRYRPDAGADVRAGARAAVADPTRRRRLFRTH